eukprot:symbB.v1.2.014788.t2/scaffold1087.1/size167708/6
MCKVPLPGSCQSIPSSSRSQLVLQRPQGVDQWALLTAIENWQHGFPKRDKVVAIYGTIADWDVSKITDMSELFRYKSSFNEPIGNWNTSAVTTMESMFFRAYAFNQSLEAWNTSAVTTMESMFRYADAFNQPIGAWNTSAVTNMWSMFHRAAAFNQPIGAWSTSAVTNMGSMFRAASSFNQPIGAWNTSAVTNMRFMFYEASAFNQPIGSWDTSSVKFMTRMFYDASAFNQPISAWSVAPSLMHHQMFGGTSFAKAPPFCPRGTAPSENNLICEACQLGHYSDGAYCQACPPGSVPSEDRGTCEHCPARHYSVSGTDTCYSCDVPLLLVDNDCVWWHLPLLAVGVSCVLVAFRLVFAVLRSRRERKVERILAELYRDLWDAPTADAQPDVVDQYSEKLRRLGLGKFTVQKELTAMRALQSKRAGVSLGYLLSLDFEQLATQRTGKENPSFEDMKTGFWQSEDPIGANVFCPRDGRPGCALVDWIAPDDRREQTHFLSWTWKYTLAEVASALKMFQQSMEDSHAASGVFFFMCFFTNNQFRIIVEESSTGSDNLESVFEGNLRRIGRMVAILDTWDRPLYLSRIWTVYEQFVASTLQIQVQFVMPEAARSLLQQQIDCGREGINEVTEAISKVDSAQAKAWKAEDEAKVKSMIQETVGFEHVDAHVTDVMITWIGSVMQKTCRELVEEAREVKVSNRVAASNIEDLSDGSQVGVCQLVRPAVPAVPAVA